MPLDHFNPADTRTIPVTFAVLPASGKRKGMFVVATGGPGTAGVSLADSYTSGYNGNIPKRFDIVFFDQRGVGLSGGLACPQAAVQYYQADASTDTAAHRQAFADASKTFAQDCVAEMSNPELLPYLGTAQAVEDLEAFRQIMGDNQFWLYGESYGTQYAQTYAAKYNTHLAGLILDATVDLTLSGFDFYAQQAQGFSDTLTASLEACNSDPVCLDQVGSNLMHFYPQLHQVTDDVVKAYDYGASTLAKRAVTYHFPLPGGGFADRQFTLADLEVTASGQMYTEGDRMMFNRALASASAYNDATPLARLLYLSLGVDPQTLEVIPDPLIQMPSSMRVECQDYGYPGSTTQEKVKNYFAAGDQVVPSIPRLGSIFYGDMPCMFWPGATDNLTRPEPLTAEGVPTLVLGATADPATPLNNGINVYQRLENGYLITTQGGAHVTFGWGNACPDNLVTNFLVKDKLPAQRETTCAGVTAEEYVPISPVDAADFSSLLDALSATETEIDYLPEYYYWDGYTTTSTGCPLGGVLTFAPSGANYAYTLQDCSFAQGFTMSGGGTV